ncbi:MAG TPA: hypothetical protein VMD28_03170, partial [Acidimicrobiales bacterium]|nr:hypothetical protein [Acidimicrobiales bacterium]
VALWKVGRRSFLVQHVVGREEREFVDTDAAMAVRPAALSRPYSAYHPEPAFDSRRDVEPEPRPDPDGRAPGASFAVADRQPVRV